MAANVVYSNDAFRGNHYENVQAATEEGEYQEIELRGMDKTYQNISASGKEPRCVNTPGIHPQNDNDGYVKPQHYNAVTHDYTSIPAVHTQSGKKTAKANDGNAKLGKKGRPLLVVWTILSVVVILGAGATLGWHYGKPGGQDDGTGTQNTGNILIHLVNQ